MKLRTLANQIGLMCLIITIGIVLANINTEEITTKESLYTIEWQNIETGFIDGGTLEMSLEDAKDICNYMNNRYSYIIHYPKEINSIEN